MRKSRRNLFRYNENMVGRLLFFSCIPLIYLLFLLFKVDDSLMVDLGRQIKMGEVIYHCQCVPQVNLFTFTHPEFPAINHSWLSSLLFYLLTSKLGLESLLYVKLGLIVTTFSIIFAQVVKKESLFASIVLSLLSIGVWSTRFSTRPELFSYLFIALFLLIFALYTRTKNRLVLWLFPVLLVVWVNLHIYFFVGIFLFAFFSVEQILTKRHKARELLVLSCFVLLAPLANPAFLKGYLYPFMIFQNYGAKIIENYPPLHVLAAGYPFTFEVYAILLFAILSCIALAGIVVVPRKELITVKLQSLLGIVLGHLLLRCMALFSLLSLPFLIQEYRFILQHAAQSMKTKLRYGINIFLVVLFLGGLSVQIRDAYVYPEAGFSYRNEYAPGVDFFLKNNLRGPIFNNLTTGNYLTYRLYPAEKVFVDSRPEAYPQSFFQNYYKMLQDNRFFNQQMDKHKINVVVFSLFDYPQLSYQFLYALTADKHWAPVYWDGTLAIFVRNNAEHAALIAANHGVKDTLLKIFVQTGDK